MFTIILYKSKNKIHIQNRLIENTLTLKRPGGHRRPLSQKIQFYFKKGSLKKFPTSVAPMSR